MNLRTVLHIDLIHINTLMCFVLTDEAYSRFCHISTLTPPAVTDIVKEMLHTVDFNKNLPIHLAVENGCLEIVKLCIDASKDLGIFSW